MLNKTVISRRLNAYMFLLPAFLVFTVIIIVSAIMGFYYSFTDWDGVSQNINFVGLINYKRMLADKVFYISVRNTLLITVLNVVVQNALALAIAILVDKKIFGSKFFRALFFIPSLLSTAIVGYMWVYILNPVVGSLPYLLKTLNINFLGSTDLLGNPKFAIYTVIFAIVWQVFGYKMVIYLSGLQSIPNEIYEAGDIDGVSTWQKFKHITFPLIAPSVTINVFLTLVNTLRIFEHVYIMTNGGPGNSTETIATMIYNVAFSAGQMGYGTAVSSVLYVATLLIAFVQLKYMRKREVSL